MLVAFASLADAQIIGSTNSASSPRSPKVDNSPLCRPTGSALRFSLGFPGLLTVAYNHQMTSSFMVGGGVGVGACSRSRIRYDWRGAHVPVMPIYAETELRTPRYKWSLFVNVKVGYSLFTPEDDDYMWADGYTYTPWFLAATAGTSYKNLHLGMGVSTVTLDIVVPYVSGFLSYSLPLSGIKRALF